MMRLFAPAAAEEERESSMWSELGEELSLSRTQRLYGFILCLGGGILAMILSALYIPAIITNPVKFAFPYTVGNVLALGSTCFLVGPLNQMKKMFDKTRVGASAMYLLTTVATLVCALKLRSSGIVMLFLILQVLSLLWYSLSYVPFARSIVSGFFRLLI